MSSSGALRVLVVDDETLIGMLLTDMLEELGCEVVGPAMDLASGLELARQGELDWAVLDISLQGEPSFPIAEALQARGVPFVFASGYGAPMSGSGYESAPVLQKPFQFADLAAALDPVTARARC